MSCIWGEITPYTQYTMGASRLRGNFAKKDLGILVDSKLTMSQQCTLAAKKNKNNRSLTAIGKHCQQVKRGDPSFLDGTGEAVSGVPCPVLSSVAQERHGHTAQGLKDNYEIGSIFHIRRA